MANDHMEKIIPPVSKMPAPDDEDAEKIDYSREMLEKNWAVFWSGFQRKISSNENLKRNWEKNMGQASELVDATPLVHVVRSLDGISMIAGKKAIYSRVAAEADGSPLNTGLDPGFDAKVGLDGHVSAHFGNPGSYFYGDHILVIDNKVLAGEKSFFVLPNDTIAYRHDRSGHGRLQDSIYPAGKLKEFMGHYIASHYEKPEDFFTKTNEECEDYLEGIRADHSHIRREKNVSYSPEIRLHGLVPADAIVAYLDRYKNDPDRIRVEKELRTNLPGIKMIGDDIDYRHPGLTISKFYRERK